MSRTTGKCLECRETFPLSDSHLAYGGGVFCSMDCLSEWTVEHKDESKIGDVAEEFEVRGSSDQEDEQEGSETSTESRRAGYRLEVEFECFEIDEYLWLDATPIADADEVKFRSESCPECGAYHWTECAQ